MTNSDTFGNGTEHSSSGTELSEADKKVREVYVENREAMTIRGLRDIVIDVFDEVEDRSLETGSVRDSAAEPDSK